MSQSAHGLEKGRISGRQMMAMLILTRLVPITIIFPMVTGLEPVQYAWLISIASTLLSLPFVALVVRLGQRFPDMTILQYTQVLLGPWAGKLLGIFLLLSFFVIATTIDRAFGVAWTIGPMVETPLLVFALFFTFLAANAARNGLEVIARIAEMLMFIIITLLLLVYILPYPAFNPENLKPWIEDWGLLFQHTFQHILTGTYFFTQFIVIGMIMPYLNRPQEAMRPAIMATLISGGLMTIQCFSLVLVFGMTANTFTLPTLSLVQAISFGEFFERWEVLTLVFWTVPTGAKLALFLWVLAVGTGQLCNLGSFQPLCYPIGALVCLGSILPILSVNTLHSFFHKSAWLLMFFYLAYLLITIG
ncbi:MAG TPA: endospore germination permease, partial [Firmicutes bacterium]|nr:endospore germination permease [Bacillota bacterium]